MQLQLTTKRKNLILTMEESHTLNAASAKIFSVRKKSKKQYKILRVHGKSFYLKLKKYF